MCCSHLEYRIASSPLNFSLLFSCLYPLSDKLYQLVTSIFLRFVSVLGKKKHLKTIIIPSVPNRAEWPIVILTHKARMHKITFLFLSPSPKLQTEAVNYISNYSNLKTLCPASKDLCGIATPCLYYELDLHKLDVVTNQFSSSPTSKLTLCSNHKNAKVKTEKIAAYGSVISSTQARFSDQVQVFGNIKNVISYVHADEIHLEPSKKATEPEAILAHDPSARGNFGEIRQMKLLCSSLSLCLTLMSTTIEPTDL